MGIEEAVIAYECETLLQLKESAEDSINELLASFVGKTGLKIDKIEINEIGRVSLEVHL